MTKQFQIGSTYTCRSACDYNCVFSFKVVSRSAQFVQLQGFDNRLRRRKVRVVDGAEQCDPLGVYSMSPVIRAA